MRSSDGKPPFNLHGGEGGQFLKLPQVPIQRAPSATLNGTQRGTGLLRCDLLPSTGPRNALNSISHHHCQTTPFILRELIDGFHDSIVNLLLVRLTQTHNKHSMMYFTTMLYEPFVRCNQQSSFFRHELPEQIV